MPSHPESFRCAPCFFDQIEPDFGLLRGELEQILFLAACVRVQKGML
jgi:hypothetical protein